MKYKVKEPIMYVVGNSRYKWLLEGDVLIHAKDEIYSLNGGRCGRKQIHFCCVATRDNIVLSGGDLNKIEEL